LNTYLNQEIHSESLLIYGAPGTGKSRGLHTTAETLSSQGRLAFVFDFLQLPRNATNKQTKFLLQYSIRDALLALDGYKLSNIRSILDRLLPLATIDGSELQTPYPQIKDPVLGQIESAFSTILSQDDSLAYPAFFEALPALQPLRPVIFLLNPERQPELFEKFSELSTTSSFIPIIAEVSDQIAVYSSTHPEIFEHNKNFKKNSKNSKKFFIPKSFRSFYLTEFTNSEAKSALKDLLPSKDVSSLYEKLGGHGASFAKAFDLIGENMKTKAALDEIIKNNKATIYRAIYGEGIATPYERTKFLKSLLTKNAQLSKGQLPIQMVNYGILTLSDLDEVTFTSKAMKEAAEQIVKELK